MRLTNEKISELKENEIFVFGSNTAGIHGAGAAKLAYDKFGAKMGIGYGLEGRSFAIPSKNDQIKTMSLNSIHNYVDVFISYAKDRPELTFLVTEIGCGLAGLTPQQVAPMFKRAVDVENIHLPQRFWNELGGIKTFPQVIPENLISVKPIDDMGGYEFNLHRHWKEDDEIRNDFEGTIRHFKD